MRQDNRGRSCSCTSHVTTLPRSYSLSRLYTYRPTRKYFVPHLRLKEVKWHLRPVGLLQLHCCSSSTTSTSSCLLLFPCLSTIFSHASSLLLPVRRFSREPNDLLTSFLMTDIKQGELENKCSVLYQLLLTLPACIFVQWCIVDPAVSQTPALWSEYRQHLQFSCKGNDQIPVNILTH